MHSFRQFDISHPTENLAQVAGEPVLTRQHELHMRCERARDVACDKFLAMSTADASGWSADHMDLGTRPMSLLRLSVMAWK